MIDGFESWSDVPLRLYNEIPLCTDVLTAVSTLLDFVYVDQYDLQLKSMPISFCH